MTDLTIIITNLANADGEAVELLDDKPKSNSQFDALTPAFPFIRIQSLPIRENQCHSSSFSEIINATTSLIDELYDTNNLTAVRFQLDSFTATEIYQGCFNAIVESLNVSDKVIFTESTSCDQDIGSQEWLADPCCNVDLKPIDCCSIHQTSIPVQFYFFDPEKPNMCAHSACAASFMKEFAGVLNDQNDPLRSCAVPTSEQAVRAKIWKAKIAVQNCREISGMGRNFDGIACLNDLDCANISGKCDLSRHTCVLSNLREIEDRYLQCYIETANSFLLAWIRSNILPSSAQNYATHSLEFREALRLIATVPDCVGTDLLDYSQRSHTIYGLEQSDSAHICAATVLGFSWPQDADILDKFFPSISCLTDFCDIPPQNAYTYCRTSNRKIQATKDTCEANVENYCVNPPHCDGKFLCAYCPADAMRPCIPVPAIASEAQCRAAVVCEDMNGNVRFDLTRDECQSQLGMCSVDCVGSSCRSAKDLIGVCIIAGTQTTCEALPANLSPIWVDNSICVAESVQYQPSCEKIPNSVWFTCKNAPSCSRTTPASKYLACFNDVFRDCRTKSECEASGRCSDIEWTRVVDPKTYKVDYGACFTSGYWISGSLDDTSLCDVSDFKTTNGCRVSLDKISNPSDCIPSSSAFPNYRPAQTAWMEPLLTKTACESSTNCNLLVNLEDRLSWRSSQACLECGGAPQQTWEWTPGVWTEPVVRSATWIPNNPTPKYTWTDALSFQITEDWISEAYRSDSDNALRSEALCQFNLITSPLQTLACDCFSEKSDDQSECYLSAEAAIPVAVGNPCAALSSTFSFGESVVEFDSNGIFVGCVYCVFSKIDQSIFDAPQVVPQVSFKLAASEHVTAAFAVVDSNGQPIGYVAGNGMRLSADTMSNVNGFKYCQPITRHVDGLGKYVYDFGYSDASLLTVLPLHLNQSNINIEIVGNSSILCGALRQRDIPSDNQNLIVFPILRLADDRDGDDQEYSTTSLALIYTLGALYASCLLFLVVFVAASFWWWKQNKFASHASLIFFTGLFFLFLSVFRVIYCFGYPSDVWSDPVANYAVFELPTFFYITSFSCVLVVWLHGTSDHPPKPDLKIIVVVNAITYTLFIAVMIAVGVISSRPSEESSACPGRVASSQTSKANDIRNLSLAYQSIMIIICFLMATAFWLSIIKRTGISRTAGLSWSSIWKRSANVFQMTFIVVVGFLTRCVLFIIILALDFTSVVYMFLTLLTTEIFVILLFCSRTSIFQKLLEPGSFSSTSYSGRTPSLGSSTMG